MDPTTRALYIVGELWRHTGPGARQKLFVSASIVVIAGTALYIHGKCGENKNTLFARASYIIYNL